MKAESLQPLSGFRDLRDERKAFVTSVLQKNFQRFGYQYLETPSLEKREILLDQYGDEAQKLLYLFEDNGKREVGLRYDLTLPLARFIAANYQTLIFPFKRFEIGTVWRAEKPQKGRYRQFTQADIDIVGDDETLGSEKEILEVIGAVAKELKLNIVCQINDRRIISAAFDYLKIKPESRRYLLLALDKKAKLTEPQMLGTLQRLDLTDIQRRAIERLFLVTEASEILAFKEMDANINTEPVEQLEQFARSVDLTAKFSPAMVRGLEYYTGVIIECQVEGFDIGSVIAGGRYDNLVESLSGTKLPAFGVSFGVDRLIEAVGNPENVTLFVANIGDNESTLRAWAKSLRLIGLNIELYPNSQLDLGKQLRYASKRGFGSVVIPLPELWSKGMVMLRDMTTGQQREIKRENLLKL